ncbi:SDR family NAD(P)-dependent oxidoreductase OS=Streptomyces rochei OX=1928 GN=G3I25_32270 PE=3 SV=1 [Streptomyces rochei]
MTDTTTQRVAVVTGATSGIGLASARLLGRQGHQVFIGARNAENVAATVKELQGEGIDADGTVVDVRDTESVNAWIQAAVDRFGSVDVVVNNAGRSGGGPTADIADERWDDVIDTNLNSVFRVTRAALTIGGLRAKDRGRIINVASTAGKQGVVLGAVLGVQARRRRLHQGTGNELAPTGITVNAVCPGYVETPMAQRVRQGYAAAYDTSEDAILEKFQAKIPLGRYSTPPGGRRPCRLPGLRHRRVHHLAGPQRLRRPRQLLTHPAPDPFPEE